VAAGILSHEGLARWWLALPVCLLGVLSGDVVLYWTGRRWGERILRWRMVRWVLTAPRAEALTEAYRQHALKTIVTARQRRGAARGGVPDRGHGTRCRSGSSSWPTRARRP